MTGTTLRRRFAATALLLSAPVNAVGLAALLGMFAAFGLGERTAGMTLGRTNDILGIVGTALMMPAVVEIHARTGPGRPVLRGSLAIVGFGAMVAIVWLQYLLVTERLPFETQVRLVMVAYAALAIWFIGGGSLAARAGVMPGGARLGAAATLYVGQPWWAWRWARTFLDLAAAPAAAGTEGLVAPGLIRPFAGRPSEDR